jgi:hypothetical protein
VPQGGVMQAWEYHVIYLDPDDFQHKQNGVPIATRALNRMGEGGWEAVAVIDMEQSRKAILFKRPGQESTETVTPPDAKQAAGVV